MYTHNLSISLDGYAAGPDQGVDAPLGPGGEALHEWVFATRYGRHMIGEEGGDEGIDDRFMAQGDEGIGATIMGRNMFGPIRGDWGDEEWKGWWGDNPPYHHPVFVLTHHPRPPLEMEGNTPSASSMKASRLHSSERSTRPTAKTSDLAAGHPPSSNI